MQSPRQHIPQFFDVLTNDFYLLMQNHASTRQTVTLFDRSTIAQSGTQTVYSYTIPSADFPLSNPKITMNGIQLTYLGSASAGEFAAALESVTGVEFTHDSATTNEYYYSKGAGSNVFGTIVSSGITYTPNTGEYAGGTQISIQLVCGITYNQFVAALPSLKSYYFDDVGIYADSSSQLQRPITITKFKDAFGELMQTRFTPPMNMFQRVYAYDPHPLYFPADGNNTFTYSINAGERVYWRLGTRCFDTTKAVGLPPSNAQYAPAQKFIPIIGSVKKMVNDVNALQL